MPDPIQIQQSNVKRREAGALAAIQKRLSKLERTRRLVEDWHAVGGSGEPTFQNSWVNYGSGYPACRFRKDATGIVRVTGLVKSGAGATIFTLPEGYRLAGTRLHMPAISNGAMCQLYVDSNGTVNVSGYSAAWVDLSPLSFEVD
jgi:hypothetical protein